MPRIDPELVILLERRNYYLQHADEALRFPGAVPDPKQVLNISVRFTGDVSGPASTGFQPGSVIGQSAYGTITLENLPKLVAEPHVLAITKQRRKNIHLDKSIPDILANQVWSRSVDNFSGITGENAIVGIVDTGINFRHESFQNADGTTRIKKIWDQTLTAAAPETAPGPATVPGLPATIPLGYGVEYTHQQINGTLQNAHLPVTVRHMDVDGHGTHVAGISAGNGRNAGNCGGRYNYIGVAPKADIIMVRMWGLTDGDTNQPSTSTGVMIDAIAYILNEAKNTFHKPVVINLSLGSYTELMNGTSDDCHSMDDMLSTADNNEGFAIVFAAGNDAAHNYHAKATVPAAPGGPLSIRFRIFPHDAATGTCTNRYIKVVYSGNNLQARVTSPVASNNVVGWVTPGNFATSNTANGPSLPTEPTAPSVSLHNDNTDNSIVIGILHGSGANTHFAGDWLLELQAVSGGPTAIDAFCLYGSGFDRESPKFLDSTTVQTNISEEATSNEVITVGSFSVTTGNLASSSGRGPLLDGRNKPEITAPGVGITSATIESTLTCANCCCDCCHDYYVQKSGTSMAAPHIAGTVALMFQKNPNITHTEIKTALTTGMRPKPAGSTPDQDVGWGAGKISAKKAVENTAAPSGGGGVQGPHAMFYKPSYNGDEQPKTDELFERFRKSKRGPELTDLFHRYFREVRDLINHNKRVATVWHRSKGPGWVRAAIRAGAAPDQPLPFEIEGFSLYEAVARMRQILQRYGSNKLVHDLEYYQGSLSLLRNGMNVYQLIDVFAEPSAVGT